MKLSLVLFVLVITLGGGILNIELFVEEGSNHEFSDIIKNGTFVPQRGDNLEEQTTRLLNFQMRAVTNQYTLHDPISIDGDDDFIIQALAEKWDGDGTETNPYIISGLNITGPINKQLISIKNTRVYFTISNCLLTRGRQGIGLANVRHGYLEHNILSNNDWDGVHLSGSRENHLVNNTIFNNRLRGIWFTGGSGNNSLIANKMNKGLFIYADSLEDCVQALVANNMIDGKPLIFWQSQTAGTVPDDAGQVIIVNCSTITITGQNISDVCANMLVAFSSHVNIQKNLLSDGKYGIYLLRSKNCTISGNIISRNSFGVFLEDSGSNLIVNNTIHDGETGIQCYGGNNIFLNNSIIDNLRRGITVYYSGPSLNTIMFNDFIDNGVKYSYSHAQEDGRNNSDYAYNFWNDRISPDNDSDGIVDIPYSISNSMYGLPNTKDFYPQTTPNNPLIIHYISKPVLSFLRSGATLSGTVPIIVKWKASVDFWGHDIVSYSVSYSPDAGSTWFELSSSITDTSVKWNTTNLPEGTDYILKVVAFCSEGFTSEYIVYNMTLLSQGHAPIYINGNEDFIATAQSEGWRGNGSLKNPYHIDGQNITDDNIDLFVIKNTNLHFLVNNCHLTFYYSGLVGPKPYAINFDNVSNGIISNTTILYSYMGLKLFNCSNITFIGNNIRSHVNGITIISSKNINIINNSVSKIFNDAIKFQSSKTSTISGNNISDNSGSGIFLNSTVSTNITRNNISTNTQHGINLQAVNFTTINQNLINFNDNYGLYLNNEGKNNNIGFNNFIHNNINGSSQAYDAGEGNTFDYNYWDDWIEPDTNKDGIVELPYLVAGPTNNQDQHPLVSPNILTIPVPPSNTTTTGFSSTTDSTSTSLDESTFHSSSTITGLEISSILLFTLVIIVKKRKFS